MSTNRRPLSDLARRGPNGEVVFPSIRALEYYVNQEASYAQTPATQSPFGGFNLSDIFGQMMQFQQLILSQKMQMAQFKMQMGLFNQLLGGFGSVFGGADDESSDLFDTDNLLA